MLALKWLVLELHEPCRSRRSSGSSPRRIRQERPRLSRSVCTVADLPWQGVAVRLQLHTRRFFCQRPACGNTLESDLDLPARYWNAWDLDLHPPQFVEGRNEQCGPVLPAKTQISHMFVAGQDDA